MGQAITEWFNAAGEHWLVAGGFLLGLLSGGLILLITVKSIGKRGLDDPFAEWEDEEESAEQEDDLSEKDVEEENNLRIEKKGEMDHEY